MRGIGVVFNIDELGGGFYGSQAWRIVMRNLPPAKILGCMLREGDTSETLNGSRREFCIAIFGPGLDVEVVKAAFASSSEKGLAPSNRRFIPSPRLDSEPLVEAGMIDSVGRLVQDEWSRMFHDRCKDCGWGFAPKKIAVDLSPQLRAELKALQDKTASGSSRTPQPAGTVFRPICPVCGRTLGDIQSTGLALSGGTTNCASCGEKVHYTIENETVTLTRVSAPIDRSRGADSQPGEPTSHGPDAEQKRTLAILGLLIVGFFALLAVLKRFF